MKQFSEEDVIGVTYWFDEELKQARFFANTKGFFQFEITEAYYKHVKKRFK